MWESPTPPEISGADRRRLRWACFVALLVAPSLMLICQSSLADGGIRISPTRRRIPGTLIACFHKQSGRYTVEREPARCEIAGYEKRAFFNFYVERIKWERWGRFRSLTSRGEDPRMKSEVRLIAFRRVRCRDGRVWYSSANVVNLKTGYYHEIALPTCDDPLISD
jgi:hypothetical protein